MVAALGAGRTLVGVSHECDFPPEVRALPRVTRTRVDPAEPSGMIDRAMAAAKQAGVSPVEIDLELVAHLRPDVLIGQAVCQVCAAGEAELERVVAPLMPTPWVVTLQAHTPARMFADITNVGAPPQLPAQPDDTS